MRKISKKGLYFGGNFEKGDKIRKLDILNIRPANKFTSFDIKNLVGLKLKKKVKKFQALEKKIFYNDKRK